VEGADGDVVFQDHCPEGIVEGVRLLCFDFQAGAPGIDFMDWKKPVLADDTLSGRSIVLEARPMRSRPGIGIVKFRHEVENQRGELVCLGENSTMIRMRAGAEVSA